MWHREQEAMEEAAKCYTCAAVSGRGPIEAWTSAFLGTATSTKYAHMAFDILKAAYFVHREGVVQDLYAAAQQHGGDESNILLRELEKLVSEIRTDRRSNERVARFLGEEGQYEAVSIDISDPHPQDK